jgi:hypothetical protein
MFVIASPPKEGAAIHLAGLLRRGAPRNDMEEMNESLVGSSNMR